MEYQDQGLLRVVGIFSHLAVADEPERPETDQQLAAFRDVLAVAEDAGVDPEVRHLANTPATLSRPDTHFDLVRVGLGIYGLSPFDGQTSAELGLRPAMTLRTLVSQCKEVPDRAGRLLRPALPHPAASTLGLIPVGYADGVPRVGHRRAGPGGRPDLPGGGPDRHGPDGHRPRRHRRGRRGLLGAEAVLFGDGADGGPTADDWARAAGTINYEIVTRISPRVPRRFINESTVRRRTLRRPAGRRLS